MMLPGEDGAYTVHDFSSLVLFVSQTHALFGFTCVVYLSRRQGQHAEEFEMMFTAEGYDFTLTNSAFVPWRVYSVFVKASKGLVYFRPSACCTKWTYLASVMNRFSSLWCFPDGYMRLEHIGNIYTIYLPHNI